MATIRASCSDCGDVELTSADVTVRVCSANSAGSYSFSCPTCSRIVVKAAEMAVKLKKLGGIGASRIAQSGFALPSEQTLQEFLQHG